MVNYKNIDEYVQSFLHGHNWKVQVFIKSKKLNGKNLVHFAAYKSHIGFYPTPSALTNFQKELSIYKTSKGTAQFKLDEDLPIKLIEKMIKFRIEENLK